MVAPAWRQATASTLRDIASRGASRTACSHSADASRVVGTSKLSDNSAKLVIPDHKLFLIPCEIQDEADFIAGVLNSSAINPRPMLYQRGYLRTRWLYVWHSKAEILEEEYVRVCATIGPQKRGRHHESTTTALPFRQVARRTHKDDCSRKSWPRNRAHRALPRSGL